MGIRHSLAFMPRGFCEVKKMVNNKKQSDKDQVEELIKDIAGNEKSLASILEMLKSLSDSGSLKVIQNLMDELIPGNPEGIVQTLDKIEFHEGGINLASFLVAFMASLSDNVTKDSISTILYNSNELWSSMVDGAKKPDNLSLFGLLGLLKDPEVAAGITVVLNALRVIGKLLKKVDAGE